VTQSGAWTVNAGTNLNTSALALESGGNLATIASAIRAEDSASADADKGITLFARRTATPANTSGTDLDYEALQMAAGRLWVDASGKTLTVDGSGVTQPVSGTFWQATQPVSGTFWQATQPVSGTFWQATQPISSVAIGSTGVAVPSSAMLVGINSSATGNLVGFPNATATPSAGTTGLVTREAARGQGAMTASIPVVIASDQSAVTVTANAGTGTFAVNQTQMNGVTLSTGLGVSDAGSQRVVLSQEATYAASTTAKTATASGTTAFFEICGSGTKTIRIQRIAITGTAATAVYGDIQLRKNSTAGTGGTATTLTNTPYDTNSAAATATVKYFTVLPTGGGTLVGNIFSESAFFPATATVTTFAPQFIYAWRDTDAEPPTLRGAAQCISAGFGTAPGSAPTLSVSVAWTEK
jgi:hypothetical protein